MYYCFIFDASEVGGGGDVGLGGAARDALYRAGEIRTTHNPVTQGEPLV